MLETHTGFNLDLIISSQESGQASFGIQGGQNGIGKTKFSFIVLVIRKDAFGAPNSHLLW